MKVVNGLENELMPENQIENAIQQIAVVQGSIRFSAYEDLKHQATEMAELIASVDVNDDNLKMSKKLLAEVNKRLKVLEDKRISIKKLMLEPYDDFESKVKEIVNIVKEADSLVRSQVKDMEEKERLEKEVIISDLFHKRIKVYPFKNFIPFLDFLKPKHLTKTMTLQAVEKEMIQFFEDIDKDMKVISGLDEIENHINAYLETYDLGQAMTIVRNNKERQAQIELARKTILKSEVKEQFHFTLFHQKDVTLLEMFMIQNGIKFERSDKK